MTTIKGIRMHLHEHRKRMQGEEDLCCPRPIQEERPPDPYIEPQELHNTLHPHTTAVPSQPTLAVFIEIIQWQVDSRTCAHEQIGCSKRIDIFNEQRPLFEAEKTPRCSHIPQHARDYHNRQPNPEQDEETTEVGIVAVRIEVGKSVLILDCWE